MTDLVVLQNNQAVTTSLNVAETFKKEHRHVLRDLDNLKEGVQNWADLFQESSYVHPQNKQTYRMIYMNRDGFTLLAMGFTGKKAIEFKLQYINEFNKMESHIKAQLDTSQLSPELQMFNQMFLAVANAEKEAKEVKEEVNNMKLIFSVNANEWREKVKVILRKIAAKGMSSTAIKKLNKLDCIAEEQRLIEIYLTVVKEMAIQFGIRSNELEALKVI
ncbi:TPA: Rha family transcriptional regulator [Listeria monocytogenes]|uniref:Rha family transcriptional regulator n=1 Tax=Listeria monocytogenes TaxID=1639 RepID=UPI000F0F855B|nr:phage regulatory protein [Listeria monocytogenes]EAD0600848.1 phage regulatory protein [Listeria monocytogenes]EAD0917195.1 phage regulatory protein [Listeria monocytogenes]EAD7248422.1 phage regulatory protein [Listeria monocytogenes]EAE7044711.1 phage regulatory protein [Listeria monocytogenes]